MFSYNTHYNMNGVHNVIQQLTNIKASLELILSSLHWFYMGVMQFIMPNLISVLFWKYIWDIYTALIGIGRKKSQFKEEGHHDVW